MKRGTPKSTALLLIQEGLATGLGKVEATANVVLLEHLTEGSLVLLRELDHLHGDLVLGSGLKVSLDLRASSEELVAERVEVVNNLSQSRVVDVTAEQDTLAGLGHAEVHGGLERSPVGLNKILAEASNLTGTGHLDTEERIGTGKTSPTELGNLGSEVVTLLSHKIDGLRNIAANKSLGSNVNEVGSQDLADKREGTRGTKVALDDLQLGLSTFLIGLDDLHVEGTGDVPGLGNLLGNLLDTTHDLLVQRSRRQDQSSITRVHTSGFNVLTDGMQEKLAVGGNSIDIDLLSTLNELGDDDGMVGRDSTGVEELLLEFVTTVDDAHGSTRQDVTGTDQDGVTDRLGEALGLGDRGKLLPSRLINTDAVQDLRELVSVLSLVNVLRIGTKNVGTASLLQAESDVLGQLTTDGHNNTAGTLEFVDIHDTLVAEFLKVELVSSVEVSGVGLGVVVDHDSLLAHVPQGEGGVDRTPIEFDRASNTVDTASKNDDTVVIEGDIVGGSVVGGVEVVCISRELSGQGIDLLNPGSDAEALPASADIVLGGTNEESDLLVGETKLLGLQHHLLLDAKQAADLLELVVAINNVLELVEEPLVDLGQLVNLVNRVVLVKHSLTNGQPAAVSGILQNIIQVLKLVTLEPDEARIDLANSLLERLLKGTTDGHDLTDRLHGTANVALDVLELAQIPAGNLGDDVIQTRLEVGGSGLGDGVGKLRESVAQTDLRSSVGKRVTSSLGGQSRRTRETGIDLNDTVVKSIRLQSVLHVTFSNDTQVADDLDGSRTEHVVLFVRKGLTGGNDDTVTGMDTQGVKVLHVADSDTVVSGVTDDFILDLLPALEGLLNQDLGSKSQGTRSQILQLLSVLGETGTQTSESVSRTDNNRVANFFSSLQSLVDSVDGDGLGDGDVDLLQGLGEQVTVLTSLEGPDTCPQNSDAVALKDAHAVHLHTKIQGSLTTERQKDAVGSFSLNDVSHIFGGNGEIVHFIGEFVIGLDSRDVGVDQDRRDTGLLESLEGLRACSYRRMQCQLFESSLLNGFAGPFLFRFRPR
ncbi:LOW QUALITY PROTEIN: hypothetical protein IFM46972_03049 [Aspergillus udagawae]|uniref:Uncharacterized protein n=1 Tax=Aspergillus udagawae TaxID=91492 RepID=A0A8H3RL12_9EURO|nr:LOW QUALITY PROTEIN: hypothetical protein IFM46972_03049 [Aspergillus udagawae]